MTHKIKTEFQFEAPQAISVAVAGTSNDWDAKKTRMKKGKDGQWRAKVALPLGRHEYRFVVDGQWISDPNAGESVPNPHGGDNSVVVAGTGERK